MLESVHSVSFTPVNNQRLATLCGQCNENIHHIEKFFDVEIHQRSQDFKIIGPEHATHRAGKALQQMYQASKNQKALSKKQVHLVLNSNAMPTKKQFKRNNKTMIQTKETQIFPQNKHQESYIDNIKEFDVNFGIGPAGTGKTYLAVARAVEALEKGDVHRLIFVRPAVEAGEKLGFLPGDLNEKVLPYLRPLYDALYDMLSVDLVTQYTERDIIEIAPLAYMRGRTLNDAFIILDEGQNTTIEQMKMFLTRIGFGSTAVITGDVTQIDLPKHISSGLTNAEKILKDIPGISFSYFDADDTVRHPLVQSVIKAYAAYDEEHQRDIDNKKHRNSNHDKYNDHD